MKKRIIAFLIFALQIFSLSAFAKDEFPVPEWMLDDVVATTAAGMGEEYTDSYSVLSFLGAVSEPAGLINPESIAERGYAVDIFAKLYLGRELPAPKKELYLDIPFEHEWADGIYAAIECGLTSEENSRFYPDKAVKVEEVAKMGLILLGYAGIENLNVSKQMQDLRFLQGITLTGDTLTKGQLFTMIRNILRADILEYSVSQKGDTVEFQGIRTGKSFLSEHKNIYLIEGVVTSIGQSAVYGKQDNFDEKIEINKIKYDFYGEIEGDILGKSIYAYVYDPEDEALVIDIWDTNDNTEYEIPGSILKELAYSYVSYTENDKTKKLKLNFQTDVVYNGQYYGSLDKAVRNNISSGCDFIKVLDNDDNGVYDIVFIDKTDYYVVDKVAPLAEQISFKYSSYVLNLKNEENVILKNQASDDIEVGSISAGYIVEVKEANRVNGEKCFDIKVSNNKITAELSETYEKNGVTYYKIGDEAYTLSSYYKNYLLNYAGNNKPEVGQTVTFYIGSNNKIVLSDSNPYTFGYLLYKREDGVFEKEVWVKLYSESGKFEELKLKDTVKVITYTNQSGTSKPATTAIAEFCDGSGNLQNQLVCYIKNSKNEITTLVKEHDLTASGTTQQDKIDENYPLVKNYTVGGEGNDTKQNRMYYRVFGYYTPSDGIWNVPTSVKNMSVARNSTDIDKEAYFGMGRLSAGTMEKYFSDEQAVFYNSDKFGNAGFLLMMGGSSASVNSRAYMVSDVLTGLSKKGEPGKIVEYYDENNSKKTIFVGESEVLSSSTDYPEIKPTDDANSLQIGDIFRFRANIDGEAEYIQIISKADRPKSNWTYTTFKDSPFGAGLSNAYTFGSNSIWSAQVVETTADYGGRLIVNIDPQGKFDSAYNFNIQMSTYTNFYGKNIINLYDSSEGTVEVASFGDILPTDRVVLVYNWTSVTTLFIIR